MLNTKLNTIALAADGELRRDIALPLPDDFDTDLPQGMITEYDYRTIFYDVFLHENGKTIIAIAPPLLNLGKILLPATIRIGAQQVRFKLQRRFIRMMIFTAQLPKKLAVDSPIAAQVIFANKSQYAIHLQPPTPLVGNTVVTMQKDNRIRWIKDWAEYYLSQPFIKHAVIYDNDSVNQDEVIAELSGIATVIPWGFPWGGCIHTNVNAFSQVGELNHFKIRYARKSLIFNFDIDELLVVKTTKAQRAIATKSYIRFDSYLVPAIMPNKAEYGAADFTKRQAKSRMGFYQYAVHSNIDRFSRGVMEVHIYEPSHNRLKQRIAKLLVALLIPSSAARKRIRDWCCYKLPIAAMEDAYFLHYKAISTNWNAAPHTMVHKNDRFEPSAQELSDLVEDNSVANAFRRINKSD